MAPRDGAGEVRRLVTEAEEVKPEPPRPLMRELPPADPFPVDALGDVLGAAARAIHDRVQAPIAIGGQSVLGAATLAAQGHADLVLPIGPGQPRPISSFLITVANSGERKTECDKQAQTLLVGEGVETCLAAMQATSQPAWAALSTAGLVALALPASVRSVVILADHDPSGAGERAARTAAARWLAEGRRVRIALPPEPGADFADVLLGRAYAAIGDAGDGAA